MFKYRTVIYSEQGLFDGYFTRWYPTPLKSLFAADRLLKRKNKDISLYKLVVIKAKKEVLIPELVEQTSLFS